MNESRYFERLFYSRNRLVIAYYYVEWPVSCTKNEFTKASIVWWSGTSEAENISTDAEGEIMTGLSAQQL